MAPIALESEDSVLVVVEGNAATVTWPVHLGVPPANGWSFLEQEEWEPADLFVQRVTCTLARFRAGIPWARVIVFVAGSWLDDETRCTRAGIAGELMGHLALCGGGNLLLTHGHLHDPKIRDELTSLASDLAQEWDDPRLVVQTRFVRPSWMPEPARIPAQRGSNFAFRASHTTSGA